MAVQCAEIENISLRIEAVLNYKLSKVGILFKFKFTGMCQAPTFPFSKRAKPGPGNVLSMTHEFAYIGTINLGTINLGTINCIEKSILQKVKWNF